ncbi:MAG: hypothetical protein A2017_04400 [Lentisphaerae bacterium GWF2_44_16]|nr:MAG: hypothetical protein A2017_04400 [Lentisphaerae bacterium GWF2_44_16]
MKSCHNCEYTANEADSFESSPCASCEAQSNPRPITEVNLEDISYAEAYASMHPAYSKVPSPDDQLIKSMAKCVLELVDMKDKYPETFSIALAKIKEPHLSYSDIARIFNCRKQNIQYHLRKAVSIYDELRHALLIDQRFN